MPSLSAEFDRLNDEQQQAVLSRGNTVVLAGPGGGKTATLAVKAAYLLAEKVSPPRAVACITYNNDTVEELRARLRELGVTASRRLFVGTVHSFCLNCVVRPYARIAIPEADQELRVAGRALSRELLQRAMDDVGASQRLEEVEPVLTRLRRMRACLEDISGFDAQHVDACQRYEDLLWNEHRLDFEGMVIEALKLLNEHQWIGRLLAARYPWLIVDEYQDLGGPLDRLVTSLVDAVGMRVYAVGDPDQTVYDFTGANPRYLQELAERQDFQTLRLKFNYRSGKRLIAASQAALGPDEQDRGYEPHPGAAEPGEVFFEDVPGGLCEQARHSAENVIPRLREIGVPLEEVAVFYRARRPMLDLLAAEMDRTGVPYASERDGRYPRTPLVRWLQACAASCLPAAMTGGSRFGDLAHYLHELRWASGEDDSETLGLRAKSDLFAALRATTDPHQPIQEWLTQFVERTGLRSTLVTCSAHVDELDALRELEAALEPGGALEQSSLEHFARDGRLAGRVVLTTLHSSKGRQFDAVIMPGLQESLLPYRPWNRLARDYDQPSPQSLRESRRLFYVGFTRARRFVFLLYSDEFTNKAGYPVRLGPSRFVEEVRTAVSGNTS